ncbi:hypothetical protein GCM10009001_07330 [Virgibacillus siamensis]|uniref:Lipoprotein n=1 Tax=Virgibacillus siamensis TaxID=480071 RepID=A0ABP3QQM2_9BACI
MRKRLLPVIMLLCLVSAACTNQPSNKTVELRPPEPTFTVDGKELSYNIGTYSWNDEGQAVNVDTAKPPHLVENMENEVASNAQLEIRFENAPSQMKGGIWKENTVDMVPLKRHKVSLPKKSDDFIYVLQASWEEGDAIYVIPFKTK